MSVNDVLYFAFLSFLFCFVAVVFCFFCPVIVDSLKVQSTLYYTGKNI